MLDKPPSGEEEESADGVERGVDRRKIRDAHGAEPRPASTALIVFITNHPNPLHSAKRKTNIATTPHEKATPAITVVASESLVITRHPAQAKEGAAVKRPAKHETKSVFTREKLASAADQSKPPVTKGKSGVPAACRSE
jgi:hypothetical protein